MLQDPMATGKWLRQGLEISDLALGSRITATGSPLIDDSRKYYLRRIRLKDGKEF
jgi:hypothetical protein